LLAPDDATPPFFFWTWLYSSFLQLDTNWINASWGSGNGQGVDGDGTAWGLDSAEYQTGNDADHVVGIGNLITGSGVPFNTTTYVPTADSPLIGAAGSLPAAVSSALPVTMQYNPTTFLMTPRANSTDIGAGKF
jgi:hypothetical protein